MINLFSLTLYYLIGTISFVFQPNRIRFFYLLALRVGFCVLRTSAVTTLRACRFTLHVKHRMADKWCQVWRILAPFFPFFFISKYRLPLLFLSFWCFQSPSFHLIFVQVTPFMFHFIQLRALCLRWTLFEVCGANFDRFKMFYVHSRSLALFF